MTRIVFLGTGGGRFSAITQKRATGGIFIDDGPSIHIDPGPGALVHSCDHGLNPSRLDGILVSHCHPDHYNDAEILVEAMTQGGRNKRGILAGSLSAMEGIEGPDGFFPAVSPYHQSKANKVQTLKPGDELAIKSFKIKATPAFHSDPSTIGFRIETKGGVISYVSDTSPNPEVIEAHKGARLLIMSVTRPFGMAIPYHLDTGEALTMVSQIKPELAVFTHMGMKFVDGISEKEALMVQNNTGVRTIAAEDRMEVRLASEIAIKNP